MIGPGRNKYLFPSLFVCLFLTIFIFFFIIIIIIYLLTLILKWKVRNAACCLARWPQETTRLIAEATSPRHHNVLRNKGCKLKECGEVNSVTFNKTSSTLCSWQVCNRHREASPDFWSLVKKLWISWCSYERNAIDKLLVITGWLR